MSAKKRVWRLKRRNAVNQDDIRYLGPLSYRSFEVLGWLCVLLSVAVVILTIVTALTAKPDAEAGQGLPRGILQYITQLSALFLLIAGISRIMRNRGEYKQQLLIYLGLAGIVAAGSALIFQRSVLAAIDKLFLEPKQILPMVEKAFADISGIGFVAYNVFIDIFLCILMFFFVTVRPKRFFTGKWVLVLRIFAALPVLYALVCTWLKYQAVCKKIVLPFGYFPLLTAKPLATYGLFLFLAIYINRKEAQFLQNGRTIEECQASLMTRRNSLRFSIVLALALAVAALVDNLLQFGGAQLLLKSHAPANVDALAWSLRTAKRVGFGGDSLVLLIAAPFMLLYSFNRVPKWRIFTILAPLIAIGLLVLLWMGSKNMGAGQYIVEGKISKISFASLQKILEYVRKANTVLVALFEA